MQLTVLAAATMDETAVLAKVPGEQRLAELGVESPGVMDFGQPDAAALAMLERGPTLVWDASDTRPRTVSAGRTGSGAEDQDPRSRSTDRAAGFPWAATAVGVAVAALLVFIVVRSRIK